MFDILCLVEIRKQKMAIFVAIFLLGVIYHISRRNTWDIFHTLFILIPNYIPKNRRSIMWPFNKKKNIGTVKTELAKGTLPGIFQSSIMGLQIGPVIITDYVMG